MSEFVNKEYVEIDFQDILIKEEELKNCTFIKCRFRGIDASEISTENCNFIECDFTGALFNASIHQGTTFANCACWCEFICIEV